MVDSSNYDNMEITKIGEDVTDEDGSDTYSAIHRFHILRYPDDNGFDFDDIEQLDIKFPTKESKNRSRRNRKRVSEARYSDVVPYENRKYWYFTTHGIGPGTIPKGVKILDVKEGQNKKGTWGDFICLNAVLNTSELKEFDLIELAPDNVYESNNNRRAFKVGDKVNSKLTATTISFNDGTIIDIDKDGLCTIECADGTVIDGIRQNRLVKSYKKESADMKNCYSEHYLSEVNNNTEEQELAEFLDWLKDENIKVVKVADKLKTIYLYNEKDLDEASFYLQDRDYFKKLYDFGWHVAVLNKSLGRKLAKTLKMESVELDGFTYNDADIVEALAYMYGISYEEVHNALKNNEFTDNEIKRAITYWNLDGYNPKEKQAEYSRRCKELGICENTEHRYRVWYRPYGLDGDEEDYIDVTASNEEEARRFARTCGNDTDVELLESKQLDEAEVREFPNEVSVRIDKFSNNSHTYRKVRTIPNVIRIEDCDKYFYITTSDELCFEYAKDDLFDGSYKYTIEENLQSNASIAKNRKKSVKEDIEDIEDLDEYIGCEATFDGNIDDIKSYFTKKEFKEIKEYIGSDCDIVDLGGPNDSYAVIQFSDGAEFTVPFDFLEVYD